MEPAPNLLGGVIFRTYCFHDALVMDTEGIPTLKPKHRTLNPKPKTLNPKP